MNRSQWIGSKELKTLNFWRSVTGEFLVTAIYIIIVCGSGLAEENSSNKPSNLHISLTVGFTVAVLASAFWEVSGGHFNPAVTFALFILKKVSLTRLLFYVIAQCAGSVVGSCLLYVFTPKQMRGGLGALSIHNDIKLGIAFLIELILTFQLIWTIVASTDPMRKFKGFQPPLAIGLSVSIGLLMGIPYTGAALNPIRAFGPAVVMDLRQDQWVYWAGPLAGALLATILYEYVFKLTLLQPESNDNHNTELFVIENKGSQINEDCQKEKHETTTQLHNGTKSKQII